MRAVHQNMLIRIFPEPSIFLCLMMNIARSAARTGLAQGLTVVEAVATMDAAWYSSMFAGERVITLVDGIYSDFDPTHQRMTLGEAGVVSEEMRAGWR